MLSKKTDLVELPIQFSHTLLHGLQGGRRLCHLIGEDTQAFIERVNQCVRELAQLYQRGGSDFPTAKKLLLDLATNMARHFQARIAFNLVELPNATHGPI